MIRNIRAVVLALMLSAVFMNAQTPGTLLAWKYDVHPDITYLTAGGADQKLDVYVPKNVTGPVPVLVYYHGGGWIWGDRTGALLYTLPYLEAGWAVVNVEYRMASTALAPAAVEDCLCALGWVWRNADRYKFDRTKIVTTGHSAGGHLALITAMAPQSAGFDRQCRWDKSYPKVAAVVNWFGITDVADVADGPNEQNYAVMWLGNQSNRSGIAKLVSPMSYVRPGGPPVITVHGDSDAVVPYTQAIRLHDALAAAKVPNVLVTVKGAGHGQFPDADVERSYQAIWKFLRENNVYSPSSNTPVSASVTQ